MAFFIAAEINQIFRLTGAKPNDTPTAQANAHGLSIKTDYFSRNTRAAGLRKDS
ncbi:hypothetical protein JBE38_26225 [Pseudomonas sp. ICBG1301]|uniref:Uncharacterized protein n=1 Tax=Pseudomonas palleroniana TaxID=191390 RepID=A0A1H5FW53_9PSED|nr:MULTISPECIES: hypothetical protein [Pseudomonas]MBI6908618.1 hypothetical protein [Pseudomonas palleroniana]MBM9489432.1 hypothetical protein [Pseudomonas sp. ICBG1301]SEE07653.1 hypothetical protein SAMN04490198_0474 [Pseudomonas palleroniana]